MSLSQIMQVSMATLRAVTTRHRHADTYHFIYLLSPVKGRELREQKQSTGTQGIICKFPHSWQERHVSCAKTHYETLLSMVALKDH